MSVSRKRCGLCQHENRQELETALDTSTMTCDDMDIANGCKNIFVENFFLARIR